VNSNNYESEFFGTNPLVHKIKELQEKIAELKEENQKLQDDNSLLIKYLDGKPSHWSNIIYDKNKELDQLEQQNKKLKNNLDVATEVIEFYRDDENWQSVHVGYGNKSQIKSHDLVDVSEDDREILIGGKKAREFFCE
jgi:predicted RNase H-like nuclease (RuvC/YqgF family)